MSKTQIMDEEALVDRALRSACDTELLTVKDGLRHQAAEAFASLFANEPAMIVADEHTFAAAGRDVYDSFRRAGSQVAEPFIFGPHVYANIECVEELQAALMKQPGIPVAVGSGTLNDLTKLAAHRLNRPYLVVATAASMDGYTAYGASITASGSKQTFDCPAPAAVLADLEVIAAAPAVLNAAGYADLLAKIPAGADWIVADALGIERIDRDVWNTVQQFLHAWVDSPRAIAMGNPAALRRLVHGLMMSGFAMQAAKSSRPASGAEHQFSHLWDMQHHTHDGEPPSHGFKVGIGSLASIALYEELLNHDLSQLDARASVAKWPALDRMNAEIAEIFDSDELRDVALREVQAKYLPREELSRQLERLQHGWPALREKLTTQLIPFDRAQAMLREAGCPAQPEEIGISRERLKTSYRQALSIRRRFTVLDLAQRAGLLDAALDRLFGPGGRWS